MGEFGSIESLKTQPEETDIRKVFPMFAPASFFKLGNWPGPYILLGAEGVGLTWALDLAAAGVRYLDQSMRAYWDGLNIDWKAAALANLGEASKERLFTHGLDRKNGGIFAVAMMHADGWGPSRLLLREGLRQVFPEGYRVSIPEMSCGFAISRELDETEQSTIKGIIAKRFGKGARPIAPGIFQPDEILPDWAAV